SGFSQLAAARVFKKLMERVGHKKFYLQGGDWGSMITSQLARIYPESVYGLHLNMAVNPIPTSPLGLKNSLVEMVIAKLMIQNISDNMVIGFKLFTASSSAREWLLSHPGY
ncbi:hypothetical protein PMAYCL1PPCAC_26940, partial [Pristionchus mayeri]